jgi:hypothetical protein
MKEIIREHTSKKVNCRLDIVVDCEDKLYPTWIKCPARSPHVQRLDVDVRLLGCADSLQTDVNDCRHLQERGRCRDLAFAIVSILARFVERGSRFAHARGEIDVHTIILHFRSRMGANKFLELTPIISTESEGDDWETDTLVDEAAADVETDLIDPQTLLGSPDYVDMVDGAELLRTVYLVLKPLVRDPQYLLARRKHHFSSAHLALIRGNVRRVLLHLDGKLERRIYVKGGMTGY